MDLSEYRNSSAEQQRTADLLRLIPIRGGHALDIGARDGHFSLLMTSRFETVTAMDLVRPDIVHPGIRCVQGNAAAMPFPSKTFDFVLCAEVLEHIPQPILRDACREIERVATCRILIGVPYMQDIRVGETTCYRCGKPNPPWGHVNSFDELALKKLFTHCEVEAISFVGVNRARTNPFSSALMRFAGNPYGTYDQEEPCIHCGQSLLLPPKRSLVQLAATKLAFWSSNLTNLVARPHGEWIHMALRKVKEA